MSVQAARLFATVEVAGATAAKAVIKGVGTEAHAAQAALTRFGGIGGVASKGLGLVEHGAGSAGAALGHLKGTIGGLVTGPLGFLGLGVGVLGLTGALKSGIDTLNTESLAIEKLTGLTGEGAAAMSGLLAVTGKFGISSDELSTIVGFTEKTLGKLSETYVKSAAAGKSAALKSLENRKAKEQEAGASTKLIDKLIREQKARDALTAAHAKALPPVSKLTALQRLYGVSLTDASGKALNYSQVLNNVSDYYQTNATAGQKAALASTVFGRGYAALIPVLQLGSKGFADAQQAAADLGLTLNEGNQRELMQYQENMRKLGDVVGGLQLRLSMDLIPSLNILSTAATRFLSDPNTKSSITGFLHTLIADSQTAAGIITGTVVPDIKTLASAAVGFWNKIPKPLQDLLVGGVIAQKSVKFLFGVDIAADAKTALESLFTGLGSKLVTSFATSTGSAALAGITQRGSTEINPLYVKVVGGLPGGPTTPGGNVANDVENTVEKGGWLAALSGYLKGPFLPDLAVLLGLQTIKTTVFPTGADSPWGLPFGGQGAAPSGGNPDGPAFANIATAERGQADAAARGNAIATANWATAIRIWNAVHAVDAQILGHERARDAVGGHGKTFHDFLLGLRGGTAAFAIKHDPAELAYLKTASDATKKTPTFARGIQENITGLKLAMVGATASQKTKLSADILAMKALLPKSQATLKLIQEKTAASLTKLQEIKDKELTLNANLSLKVDGSTLAKAVLTYTGGKRLA